MASNASRFPAELLKGTTDLVVLAALRDDTLHGYALMQHLRKRSGERFRINEGSLYPLLHRLERDGFVVASTETVRGRERRAYGITEVGLEELERRRSEWNDFRTVVEALIEGARP